MLCPSSGGARSLSFLCGSPAAVILLHLELSSQDQRAVGGLEEVTVGSVSWVLQWAFQGWGRHKEVFLRFEEPQKDNLKR